MESTLQLQPPDSLDTNNFLTMLDYDCETPAVQLPELDRLFRLHDSSQDNPSTTTSSSEVEPNSLPQSMCLAAALFLSLLRSSKLLPGPHLHKEILLYGDALRGSVNAQSKLPPQRTKL